MNNSLELTALRPMSAPQKGPSAVAVGGIGAGDRGMDECLSVSFRSVRGVSEPRFRRTPVGACSLGLQYGRLAKVLRSASYVAASVGDVSESTVRRSVGHPWDEVA
jgi:hypothetical protein